MKETIHTVSKLGAGPGRDIEVVMLRDGFEIWYGPEYWTTVSSLAELSIEISDILNLGCLDVDKTETSW